LVFIERNILLLTMFYKSNIYRTTNAPLYILSSFSVIGVFVILWLTRWGIAINNDSTVYIASALNFSRGIGLSEWAASGHLKPMTHFPPLYPLLLAFTDKLGFDILPAARFLNAFLFGANIFLVGLLSLRLTAWRHAPIAAGFLFLFATHLLLIHMTAVSEPLFIFLALLGIRSFVAYIDHGAFPKLIMAGLFWGLASLCRYIGIAFILAGILYLIFFTKTVKKIKIVQALTMFAVSFSGIFFWVLRNLSFTGSAADRSFNIYQISNTAILKGFQTILWWLMFERYMTSLGYIRLFTFILILFLLLKYWGPQITVLSRKRLLPEFTKSSLFILLCLASYIASLFFSILFFDPAIMLDYRILSPVYILLLLLFPVILKPVKLNRGLTSLFVIWAVSAAAYGIWWGLDRTNSVKWDAYQRFNWRKIGSLTLLDRLPNDAAYLTNDPELLYALSGKVPNLLNRDKLFTLMNPEVPTPLAESRPDTYLVFFKQKVSKPFLPSLEDIRDIPGLNVIFDSPQIYICRINS
ncbi:MAG: glycosyltransferase family 39 protein, partial [Candidatus Edwardsbacteria bacterium]|nr:glycosyltransferase family 39 protein [Candidatus Edwardsbacteria bacterium]MBU1577592.1 glycosyltransferase family 39 protein [Candidatus Edwardsbacteria bacterium]